MDCGLWIAGAGADCGLKDKDGLGDWFQCCPVALAGDAWGGPPHGVLAGEIVERHWSWATVASDGGQGTGGTMPLREPCTRGNHRALRGGQVTPYRRQ